jgi:hypothetical protein
MIISEIQKNTTVLSGLLQPYKVNELDLTFPELTNQNPVISNFEVVEVEEEEETPVEAPQEEDKEDREFGRDDEGNLYRKVDGLWKPLK